MMYLKVGPHVRSEQRVNVADPLAFHFVGHINRLEHPERPHEQHCLHVRSSSHGTSFRDLESGLFFPTSHFDLSLIVISTFHCIFCVCRIWPCWRDYISWSRFARNDIVINYQIWTTRFISARVYISSSVTTSKIKEVAVYRCCINLC